MLSGKTQTSRLSNCLAIALFLLPEVGCAAEWGIPRLMGLLNSVRQPAVWFDEEKRVGVLEVPLEQSGILEYREPDYLKKHVQSPEEQIFEIDGDHVRLVQPGRPTREVGLDELPLLRTFAEGFRALLAGDLAVLERHYHLTLAGDEPGWTLTLTPRDQEVAAFVTSLEFRGRGGRVDQIRIDENGGDSSTMRIRALP